MEIELTLYGLRIRCADGGENESQLANRLGGKHPIETYSVKLQKETSSATKRRRTKKRIADSDSLCKDLLLLS